MSDIKTEKAQPRRLHRMVGQGVKGLTPRTDALLALRRHETAPDWNADDVMAFLRHARKLERAIMWALGENGDFAQRKEGQGAYWWRTELRKRCAALPNVRS